MTRVAWSSPDSFYVMHMGQVFGEPVINYSTYSGDDADSQQLFYVNSTLIGDTLDIYGNYYYYPEVRGSGANRPCRICLAKDCEKPRDRVSDPRRNSYNRRNSCFLLLL